MFMQIIIQFINSLADKCENCAKCGKGFKIGANEAHIHNIRDQKIRVRAFQKFSACVRTPIWLPQTKAFH